MALIGFLAGLFTMGFAVIGVFFLRFWAKTREPLFAGFALSFWLLAAGQTVTVFRGIGHENHGGAYLLRLAAFVLILVSIVGKNLTGSGKR
jgi:hypothetical protein